MMHLLLFGASLALCCVLTVQQNCLLHYDAVMFSVGLNTTASVKTGENLKYNRVFYNIGGGYDINTGIYTVPKDGVYLISVNGINDRKGQMYFSLFHNTVPVVSIYGNVPASAGSSSNTIILSLKRNEKLYVKAIDNSDLYGSPELVYSTLTVYRMPFA